ncbi:hypothetical protein NPIL_28861 [Nephila pilipes]|uniref:Uncharacterized protein n=1 Tax=Nephila pilipes TaxID=299642 RepID=A0A8X6MAB9_NEPPI|nr:hypothetical protein NPIL_28861 [Nephila pilipes]
MKKLQNFRKHSAIFIQQAEENPTEHRRGGGSRAEEDGRERNGDSTRRDTPRERGFGTVVESRIRFSGELVREKERRCSETGPGKSFTAVRHKGIMPDNISAASANGCFFSKNLEALKNIILERAKRGVKYGTPSSIHVSPKNIERFHKCSKKGNPFSDVNHRNRCLHRVERRGMKYDYATTCQREPPNSPQTCLLQT